MSNVPYKKYLSFNYFIIIYKTFFTIFTLNSGCFGFGGACQYARAIEFISYSCSYNFYLCFLFIKEMNCAFYQKLKFEVFDKHTCFSKAHVFFIPYEFIAFFCLLCISCLSFTLKT